MAPENTNPYTELRDSQFWRTAVARRGSERFDGIWRPKFTVSESDAIVTAGSCFAQHISRWLTSHGYRWLDAEPGEGLTDEQRAEGGHGVFSFRTGNIYTAALLRQWVRWALGLEEPVYEIAERDGRFFDLYRPALPTRGYASPDELREDRERTLRAIRAALTEADLFIFTLGLTECWENSAGVVYPLCPGTAVGTFDPQEHHFANHDFTRIRRDLEDAFEAIRTVNPDIRFLLTVSPVPLTATASADHVLPATTYSKSVLRAVAGSLSDARDDVDYFPSYELITAPATFGRHYEANLRTVKETGVAYVMSHFSDAIGARSTGPLSVEEAEIFCEDEGLERWQQEQAPDSRLLVFGSSQMGRLASALRRRGIPVFGGKIMGGLGWFENNFVSDRESFFIPLESRGSRVTWEEALGFFDRLDGAPRDGFRVITDIGLQAHRAVEPFERHLASRGVGLADGVAAGIEYVTTAHRPKLDIVQRMLDRGVAVTIVTDPPTQQLGGFGPERLTAIAAYELLVSGLYAQMGCTVFNARDHFAERWSDAFYSTEYSPFQGPHDWVHGSPTYYDELAAQLIELGHIPGGQVPGGQVPGGQVPVGEPVPA